MIALARPAAHLSKPTRLVLVASSPRRTLHSDSAKLAAEPANRAQKKEGDISSVFATLSGGNDPLPPRFAEMKQSFVKSTEHAEALKQSWSSILAALKPEVDEISRRGGEVVPSITYPGPGTSANLKEWVDSKTYQEIKRRGAAIIKNVVPPEQALRWKEQIKDYVAANPSVKGFPADDKQVFELYWSKAQVEARANPNLLDVTRAFLQLFHAPHQETANDTAAGVDPLDLAISLETPVVYADRLRIRHPGDMKFALGPHIDGGGVERWEDPYFKMFWNRILENKCDWREHDAWSLGDHGERLAAKGDLYQCPGGCSVFRPLQGWLSMSSTAHNEGTLRLLPMLKEQTAYIILRPFFRPIKEEVFIPGIGYSTEYLAEENWVFDPTTSEFPGCSLGHSIELNEQSHPHLHLDKTMVSIPRVEPGDMVLWHTDVVHAVENEHKGKGDSSVMYIPAIPLTKNNWTYVAQQREEFLQGVPPSDFPGGDGEQFFTGRATGDDVVGAEARRAMGLDLFDEKITKSDLERDLVKYVNANRK
ncbi:hypothetical protein MNV49_004171 [Pseudohyphozyma bogoriensis]|nr:hypothetical protein MNV49_004171 [Pseudohyphozyma bogoriensis]